MPELPEVETVRRGLAPVLEDHVIAEVEARRPDLRYPLPERFAERLRGRRVEKLTRRAKYLLAALEGDEALVMHLGMSGSFRIEAGATPGNFHWARPRDPMHDHVLFQTEDGPAVIYNDPRRFGFMDLIAEPDLESHPYFRDLGIEPVGDALTPEALAVRLACRRAPLKAALLDQKVIAGLGNIYVCEALWRAGLSPRREARSLVRRDGRPGTRLLRLTGHIRDVIAEAIDAGGSSLRDHAGTDGAMGYFQQRLHVYDRLGAPCPRPGCRGTVGRIVQSGRATFLCAACQR